MPRIKPVSLSNAKGLCQKGIKCVKQAAHSGACWPADKAAKANAK